MRDFPDPDLVTTNDVKIAIYRNEPRSPLKIRPLVVLVHGWPEIAYSWKSVLNALGEAGIRALAIDVRGFGRSDAPEDPAHYSITSLTDDLVGILDALGEETAIFCGHDWGGAQVWPLAQLHPDRVTGVVGLCTPHLPPPPVPPLGIIEKRFTERHYFVQFQKQGEAEALFESDIEKFFRIMFRRPPARSEWEGLIPRVYDLTGRFEHGPTPDWSDVLINPDEVSV
ncbi:MAG: alpha/beta hydrolase, partial [Pseudomonadota bacterium]